MSKLVIEEEEEQQQLPNYPELSVSPCNAAMCTNEADDSSPLSEDPIEETVLIDLLLLPGPSRRRKYFPISTTLWQIKEAVEKDLRIPSLVVALCPLRDGWGAPGVSGGPRRGPSRGPSGPLPWSTTVKELGFTGGPSPTTGALGVYIYRPSNANPQDPIPDLHQLGFPNFLKDATAGIDFVLRNRCSVCTQTCKVSSCSTQCMREDSCCSSKKGLFLSSKEDKEMQQGVYVTADEWEAKQQKAAVVLQRHARAWAARKEAQQRRQQRDNMLLQQQQKQQRKQWEAAVRKKRQQQRGGAPSTAADFAVLHAEVAAWRCIQENRIKEWAAAASSSSSSQQQQQQQQLQLHLLQQQLLPEQILPLLQQQRPSNLTTDQQRRQALLLLLQQETQLLQRIEGLKQKAEQQRKQQQQQRLLIKMKEPLIWVQSNGDTATVHTPQTDTACKLHALYQQLAWGPLDVPKRLEVLAAATAAVKEWGPHGGSNNDDGGALAAEVLELLQREVLLLQRGRSSKLLLSGLRQRINSLFSLLLLNPSFNPQAKVVTAVAYAA